MERIFEALTDEHDYAVTEIDGRLPADLTGTLYRIGPGRWEVGRTRLHHLFDGDGMISQFTFDGESVHFRNRYVRTRQYVEDRMRRPGVGSPRPGGRLANLLRPPANVANTGVVLHQNRLLALWEGGPPHSLDPDTLGTHGVYDFEGRLRGTLKSFSAHPKWDPATGEMFNFGQDFGPIPALNCWKADRRGRLTRLARIRMLDMPWNHDVALTARHLVFVLDPYRFNVAALATGRPLMDTIEHRGRQGTRFVLVPRDGGPARIIEHDALVHVHVSNAFEDGDDTVVDLVLFDDFGTLKHDLTDFRASFTSLPPSRLMRYRITRHGKVIAAELTAVPGEFPQFDRRLATRPHRYTYLAGRTAATGPYDSVLKVDNDSGDVIAHPMGPGSYVGEPIFVARAPDAAEDDGRLLVVVYDEAEHRSRLVILDARDPAAAPIATAHLKHHLPLGFHGTFTPRVAAR